MRRFLSFALPTLLAVTACRAAPTLEELFTAPPPEARTRVWWHWMGGNVSKDGITRDLEAMREAGIGGATIFGMADVCTPWAASIPNSPNPGLVAFTDPWWKLVRHAAAEARRLDIDLGVHNCPGYESSGGPWITPELSMLELCHSSVAVEGGKTFSAALPRPVVDPRAVMQFPVVDPASGKAVKPEIEGRKSFYREVAVLALPAEGVVPLDRVIDLTSALKPDGSLEWSAPAGSWKIYRIGYTTLGTITQPNQWEANGLECDKMSAAAVNFHLDRVLGDIRRNLGDLTGTGLRHILFDSYEAGTPGWTPLMPEEFKARRGYDLRPFLATVAGRVVGGEEETRRYRGDFARTIADLYRDVYFPTVAKRLKEAGLVFECEPYGGPWHMPEVTPHVEKVMVEFWISNGKFSGHLGAGARRTTTGEDRRIIASESFTLAPQFSKWTEHPAWLKPVGDSAFLMGINQLVLHHMVHQPWDDRYQPGNAMGQWGTHFNRHQTWWKPGKAMLDYWARSQALLQWGAWIDDSGVCRVEHQGPGMAVAWIGRREGDTRVYFVTNPYGEAGDALLSFAHTGQQPELWDANRGDRHDATLWREQDGATLLPLRLDAGESRFVVFRRAAAPPAAPARAHQPRHRELSTLGGSWEVEFDAGRGGPREPLRFTALEDWIQRPEAGVRHYSGTAVYRKSFDLPPNTPSGSDITLHLGTVRELARVRLNGRDLGVVWTAPWSVDLPAALLRETGNRLEVEVTNVWANRLIGDEHEPADCEWTPGFMGNGGFLKRFPDWFVRGEDRPSRGRHTFTTWNYFTKDSPLSSSGLLGPVRLLAPDFTVTGDPFALPEAGDPASPLLIRPRGAGSPSGLESALPARNLLAAPGVTATDKASHAGGGGDASAMRNGTTRNGAGGADSADDGRTFRGYDAGDHLVFTLDTQAAPRGYDLTALRAFAGHPDGRASQHFTVSLAFAGKPAEFVPLTTVKHESRGGASLVPVISRAGGVLDNGHGCRATGVVAIRFDFKPGPFGFNVYREFTAEGSPTRAP